LKKREGLSTRPIASPIMKTRVWSAIVRGFVRKKKASVMWKSDRDVMIVAAEMTAILSLIQSKLRRTTRRGGSWNGRRWEAS
jgi:hypothetical protein